MCDFLLIEENGIISRFLKISQIQIVFYLFAKYNEIFYTLIRLEFSLDII